MDAKKRTGKEMFLMESLGIIVDGLARAFGSRCEVSLQDLKNIDHAVIKIANGHVTGRDVGDTVSTNALKFLRSGIQDDYFEAMLATEDNRHLKAIAIILRDDTRKRSMALVIHFDVTDILNYNMVIEDIFGITDRNPKDEILDQFDGDSASTMNHLVGNVVGKMGKLIPTMSRQDKIELVRQLDDQGFFVFKGSVKYLAKKLNISKSAIYNYLDGMRSRTKVI